MKKRNIHTWFAALAVTSLLILAGPRADAVTYVPICDIEIMIIDYQTSGGTSMGMERETETVSLEFEMVDLHKKICICRFEFEEMQSNSAFSQFEGMVNLDMYRDLAPCGVPEPSRGLIGLFGLMGAVVCHRRRKPGRE